MQAPDHRGPLFDREFIERVTRSETRLLQLAIIVELGIFASVYCTLWLACPKSITFFTETGNDGSRESFDMNTPPNLRR
jgi:hypothetical protein